jgi:hypothetical protein
MAIDHVIDLNCVPKKTLTTDGILQRLKGKARANAIIRLYRERGENRRPSDMGFELERRTADGSIETQVVVVQDLLDEAAELDPLAHHCAGCPANRRNAPFGCFDAINYPLSQKGELWLISQLPTPADPLVFLLFSQMMQDFAKQLGGDTGEQMRRRTGIFFESEDTYVQRAGEYTVTSDQIFEMLFLNPAIQPTHASLLLLFFGAIPRSLDADAMMNLMTVRDSVPFAHEASPEDDETITALKGFFEALYRAYRLNVSLSLDV